VAALEYRLESEQSNRKIERFFWILAVTGLCDALVFKFEDAAVANIFIGALSLILVIGCARWLEVPWVHIYLDRLFNRLIAPAPNRDDGAESEEK